jgi:hypothetical protein
MNYEILALTPVPAGYEESEIYLRRWILDLRLRVRAIPKEREILLEHWVHNALNGTAKERRKYVTGTTSSLVAAVR